MICPYNVKVHVTVQQWVQEYSEENENQLPTGTTRTNEYLNIWNVSAKTVALFITAGVVTTANKFNIV